MGGCVKGLGAHIGSCIRLSGSFWALSGLSVVFCYPLCGWLEPLESWFMGILCCLWTQWWLYNSIIILLTNIYNIILFVFLLLCNEGNDSNVNCWFEPWWKSETFCCYCLAFFLQNILGRQFLILVVHIWHMHRMIYSIITSIWIWNLHQTWWNIAIFASLSLLFLGILQEVVPANLIWHFKTF